MKWTAVLRGNSLDLQRLANVFGEDDPRVSVDDNGIFVLDSTQFDGLPDVEAIQPAAEALLVKLNGAVRLSNPSHRPVELAGQYRTDNMVQVVLVDTIGIQAHVGTAVIGFGGESKPAPPPGNRAWFALSRADQAVDDALRLLGSSTLDYVNLYKLFEIVRDDVGGEGAIVASGWATATAISAFRAAANRPDVSGDGARHARMSGPPPRRALTEEESRSFVLALVQQWLDAKASSTNP